MRAHPRLPYFEHPPSNLPVLLPEADDTDKSAQKLIEQHGAMALAVAAARIRVMVAEGNIEGAAAWALIRERIKALTMPPG